MTKDDIDQMWNQAMNEAVKNGENFTRYRFAALVAEHEREACETTVEDMARKYQQAHHPSAEHAAVRELERLREVQRGVDAVAVLTEEGWIWDGNQWQRPALQSAWLLESTQTLAKTLAREFYPEVTQWECLNDLAGVISQIDNMTTGLMRKPEQKPVSHSVIAGALFDFMGWLTSRDARLVLSGADEASPAVDAITDFAKMRGLSLDDARVQDWHTTPPAAQRPWVGLTDEDWAKVEDMPDTFEQGATWAAYKLERRNT